MKHKRFMVEEIVKILRECEGGVSNDEVCCHHNISEQTQYRWKRKYGSMEISEAKYLKSSCGSMFVNDHLLLTFSKKHKTSLQE